MSNKIKATKPASPYTSFVFQKYSFNPKSGQALFYYAFDNKLTFCEKLQLPKATINRKINQSILDAALFNLHLALGLSYYKAYCPAKIIIKSGQLNAVQAKFWNNLYQKGLGEFSYKNKLDLRNWINFPANAKNIAKAEKINLQDRSLSLIGGGKDSCLAAEMLKAEQQDFALFSLGDSPIQSETSRLVGKKRIIINRTIDSQLFTLNQAGAYNGHVPISSIYAFSAVLAAILYDYRHIILANERSANFGNLNYLGQEINHQYSKSFEFELELAQYINDFITPELKYFSLLRRYSELRIMAEFSRLPKYLPAFSSCNRNFKITKQSQTKWCGECPKCAFSFNLLSAFIPMDKLVKIFKKNLYQDQNLLPLFLELWGQKNFKPFDCVGEPQEALAASLLALKQKGYGQTFVLKHFAKNVRPKIKNPEKLITDNLSLKPGHHLPESFQKIIILGYGQEGQAAVKYFHSLYPHKILTVADQKPLAKKEKNIIFRSGKNYLSTLSDFDLIIKSPGIPSDLPEIVAAEKNGSQVTTNTNLFFQKAPGLIIGVTGTKGKSTTSKLIYEILKQSGLNAKLAGNIGGNDPLAYLRAGNQKNPIFVYELSSYQLSTLPQSPQISVFLNIFPDHLPYHHGLTGYQKAKANISKYQTKTDFLVYNSQYPFIKNLARKTPAKAIDYLQTCALKNGWITYRQEKIIPSAEIKLLGQHNLENIMAAICVAKILKIENHNIRLALKKFHNLKHRLELVGTFQGITFYDDAISTTPESTLAAIETLKDKLETIFLGGQDRGYKFQKLAKRLMELNIKNVVLFPDSGAKIWRTIQAEAKKQKKKLPQMINTSSMAQAVKFAYQKTAIGKICLLSTASPSYSIFKNFTDKGDQFQANIKKH
ncbi:MAG TPA: UDP-N-acetylmuramoyl-L-alanine--D-glutamate ligase [bacterium]|nr:UDP-N-acetylmuramoyl-L-alanine--D-glutamate ligase [bacterium]HPT29458.1 UDP-N-acetylmuramoyl-L-alanine--D-glutamate ligase [bacterium]